MEVTPLLVDSVMTRIILRHYYVIDCHKFGIVPRRHFACGHPDGSLWVFHIWAEAVVCTVRTTTEVVLVLME